MVNTATLLICFRIMWESNVKFLPILSWKLLLRVQCNNFTYGPYWKFNLILKLFVNLSTYMCLFSVLAALEGWVNVYNGIMFPSLNHAKIWMLQFTRLFVLRSDLFPMNPKNKGHSYHNHFSKPQSGSLFFKGVVNIVCSNRVVTVTHHRVKCIFILNYLYMANI